GHEVVLFASGDSETSAELVACSEHGLRLNGGVKDFHAYLMIQLAMAYARAEEFDIIHSHVDYFAFPFARLSRTPTVTTMHGRLDLAEVRRVNDFFREHPLVSISRAQRVHLPRANWIANVHNGIAVESFTFYPQPGRYLAFLGRISLEKRLDRAIEVARAVGMPLLAAAKVDPVDAGYYEHAIRPLLDGNMFEFVGEIGEQAKDAFLGQAYAYLFPIDWPEPFGITMIEAMATGTPVIAMDCGSVREVVVDGVTGFICRDVGEMIRAVHRIPEISRQACRAHVQRHFARGRMAAGYLAAYRQVLTRPEPVPA
ncbi:MAG TPA: glycosyltransferase family 4 protein, partial [bacterium]|nr:glycosyltransferase family 4 protein [bacterium]